MSSPEVSVVIPTLNGGGLLRECLDAVSRQELDRDFDILVVDSGSRDGSDSLAENYGRVVRIPKSEFNHGLTRNLGISETTGGLVALLVQDAVPCDGHWLQRLVDVFEDPLAAGAYAKQVPRENANPVVAARLKRWSAGGSEKTVKLIDDETEFDSLEPAAKVDIVSFDNVSSMIRREVWEKMPFPEASFGEDTRWSLDVLRAGWKIVYEPAAAVRHSHSNSLWYEFKRVYMDHQNWNKLVGLKLFPEPLEIFRAGFNGVFERWAEINEKELKLPRRLYWKCWSVPYSFSQNLAQFMGAVSNKWMETKPWFRRVDAALKKGV